MKIIKNFYKYFKKDTWIHGKVVKDFEIKIEKKLKSKLKACSCNSGSDALLLALILDKNNKKDIYITTPLSYIASSSMAKFLGLQLIYIDVSESNYLLDVDKIEIFLKKCPKKILRRINGIINVELFGSVNNLTKLKKISKKYNLSLVGDCSQSFGSIYKNQTTINYYDYGVFSFYPTKLLSCYGDGGVLFVKKKLLSKAKMIRNNGHDLFNKEVCNFLGFNSRLDSIQAYVLNKNLDSIDHILNKKKIFVSLLKNNLPNYLQLPNIEKNSSPNNYIMSFYINKNIRNNFIKYMKANSIECKIFYNKLISSNKILRPIVRTNLYNAHKCTETLVCIPSHDKISLIDFKKIIKKINFFNNCYKNES